MSASKLMRLTFLSLFASACATTSGEKIFRNMVVAGAIGAAVGASKEEFKTSHAVMYGSSAAAIAAALSLWVYDPDKEINEAKKQAEFYKSQLDSFDPKRVETRSSLGGKIPDKYKNLILPGELNISQIDQWVDDGENRLIHQDQIVELLPPSLRPFQKQIKKESK